MPTPATAPPRVMVFSCGTTAGITPRARQARGQRLVGDHALGIDPARRRIDREHLAEIAHVQAPARRAGAVAKEVRRFLGERRPAAAALR